VSDENSEPVPQVDLFGQPILPIRDRRGRPSFKKDKTNQDFVAVRVAAGWTQKAIADDMGIDEKTLRKHFSRELEVGRLSIEGLMLDVLLKLVREGKTAAVGRLHEMMKAAGPQAPRSRGASLDEDDDTEDDRPVKVGKKEQAQRDAQDIPPDYGDIFARMQRH
jgi:AraC-like DNA-binding protein